MRANPGAAIVADGDAALAALLASAVVPVPIAVLDVGRFDTSSDAAYLERLYIPGLRRAGDLQTAASLARGKARRPQCRRSVRRQRRRQVQAAQLTPEEIAAVLRRSERRPCARRAARLQRAEPPDRRPKPTPNS